MKVTLHCVDDDPVFPNKYDVYDDDRAHHLDRGLVAVSVTRTQSARVIGEWEGFTGTRQEFAAHMLETYPWYRPRDR